MTTKPEFVEYESEANKRVKPANEETLKMVGSIVNQIMTQVIPLIQKVEAEPIEDEKDDSVEELQKLWDATKSWRNHLDVSDVMCKDYSEFNVLRAYRAELNEKAMRLAKKSCGKHFLTLNPALKKK